VLLASEVVAGFPIIILFIGTPVAIKSPTAVLLNLDPSE